MKIGLIAPGGFDAGGRERVIPFFLWFIGRLARDHDVHVFTLNQYPDPVRFGLLGAKVHNIGHTNGRARSIRQAPRLVGAIYAEHRLATFDVLHGLWAAEHSLIAVLCGRALGVATVVTVVGGELLALPEIDYGGQLRMRSRAAAKLSLQFADSVTCASEQMTRLLETRRRDVRTIPFGVDCDLFAPSCESPFDSSESTPLSYRLLHVASLNRVKDQPMLLRAFARVREELPGARLDIVGADTLNGAIQQLARELRIEGSVTFRGFEPSDIVAGRMRDAHLLLHSSLSEAGPVVVLEAAACGVPCVGTAVGHIADMAPDAAAAVAIGDDAALAAETIALLRDPDRRRALGQNALRYARRFDANYTAHEYNRLYRSVAAKYGSAETRNGKASDGSDISGVSDVK